MIMHIKDNYPINKMVTKNGRDLIKWTKFILIYGSPAIQRLKV